ncbi:MAG: DUF4214 domain-containing protein [Nitrosomonadaceae bacterium]|nr:DUF4214 domain-containing protein [Nitrosomonadaceae bacterium]
MATVTSRDQMNMADPFTQKGLIKESTASLIVANDGYWESRYTGSFGYSSSKLVSGTLTGYSESAGGIAVYEIKDVSVPVTLAFNNSLPTSNLLSLHAEFIFAGGDTFNGSGRYPEVFLGYAGNDRFNTLSGSDTIDGGTGTDTVIYDGKRSDHTVSKVGGAWHSSGPKGLSGDFDTLTNVERLSFTDGTLGLDTVSGSSGVMYRLYKAAFDRVPDAPGLGHNIRLMDGGLTLAQMSDAFVVSAEFTNTYGALSNAQFINQLYLNVLDRTPDAPGLAWNVNLLNTTHKRHEMLSGFSESAENQAAVIGQIQDGIWFT